MPLGRMMLQLFANHCTAAAEAMGYTLMRTAHSTFVKETQDFTCGLLTPDGLTFASPITTGVVWFIGLDYGPAIRMVDHYEDGDVCITNDPYSGFVSTHSPDIHIWKPVFWDGELVCFVASHIHNTDMGGAVPATLSRSLTEVHQEGIRVPPVKVVRAGKVNDEVLSILLTNVRAPEQNWGDLKAQFAALNIGERKIKEVIARFGVENFKSGMGELLDYAEEQAREVVREVPDGDYHFAEYADEDADGGLPLRIALTLRIRGDGLELDYTGSDPQVSSSLNIPTGGNPRHSVITVGLTYVLYTLNHGILRNAGTLRVADAVLPKGTVVNPEHPAAVGMRSLTGVLTQLATIGAFAQALPHRLMASPGATGTMVHIRTLGRHGHVVMASLGPVSGGGGGSAESDGAEGAGGNSGATSNTPVEISEAEIPIRFRRYGLRSNSGGAGRHRGGHASVMEFEVFSPETVITARNRNKSNFASWGFLGGKAGVVSRFVKNPGRPDEVDLGSRDLVHCDPGDTILVLGPGAGGYGDPHERAPEAVLQDVRCGFVSLEEAHNTYGVVILDNQVDTAATEALRRTSVGTEALFDYGSFRDTFEEVWNPSRYAALSEAMTHVSVPWRHFAKHRVFQGVANRCHADLSDGDQVRAILDDLAQAFPQMLG